MVKRNFLGAPSMGAGRSNTSLGEFPATGTAVSSSGPLRGQGKCPEEGTQSGPQLPRAVWGGGGGICWTRVCRREVGAGRRRVRRHVRARLHWHMAT